MSARVRSGILALCLSVTWATPAFAQTPPAFAAVSIKPFVWKPGVHGPNTVLRADPDGIHAWNRSLRDLIQYAYGLEPYQVAGGAPWTQQERYNLDATTIAPAAGAQLRLMMRSVLKDRFGLRLVKHIQPTSVLAVVVAPGGLKLPRPLAADEVAELKGPVPPNTFPYAFDSPHELATWLDRIQVSRILGGTVVDETGLSGRYDFVAPLPSTPITTQGIRGERIDWTALPSAIKVFGLELKRETIPLTVYTIANAHSPTPN